MSLYYVETLKEGDVISLDGQTFSYPGEDLSCAKDDVTSYEDTKFLVEAAGDRGIHFHLWRHEWQGLNACGGGSPAVEDRTFEFKYPEYIKELLLLN